MAQEEERIKAKLEAEEYARLHPITEATHKERREPKTKAEKIDAAKKRKNQGNTLFKEGDYENAITRYSQVIHKIILHFNLLCTRYLFLFQGSGIFRFYIRSKSRREERSGRSEGAIVSQFGCLLAQDEEI